MNILILGSTGFIGNHLFKYFKKKFPLVIGTYRRKNNNISDLKNQYKLDFSGDWKNLLSEIIERHKINIVINCISYGVNYSEQDSSIGKIINSELPEKLYVELSQKNINLFIHLGSSQEYGNTNEIINEKLILNPQNMYGKTKAIGTKNLISQKKVNSLSLIILRLFSVYGKDEKENKIIPYLARSAKLGKIIKLTGGNQLRNYIYIDDLVKIISYFIQNKKYIEDGIYNISSPYVISIKQLANEIYKLLNADQKNLLWGKVQYRNDEIFKMKIDRTKINEVVNIEYTSIKDGLKKTIL